MNYKVRIDKNKYGPFSFEKICELLNLGKINENTYVLKDDSVKWLQIKEMEEFFPEGQSDKAIDDAVIEIEELKDKRPTFSSMPNIDEINKTKLTKVNEIEEDLSDDSEDICMHGEPKNEGLTKIPEVKRPINYDSDNDDNDTNKWFLVDGERKEGPIGKERARKLLKDELLSDKAYAYRADKKEMLFPDVFKGSIDHVSSLNGKSVRLNITDEDSGEEETLPVSSIKKKIKFFFVFTIIVGSVVFFYYLYLQMRPCPSGSDLVEIKLQGKNPSEFILKRLILPISNPYLERFCRRASKNKSLVLIDGKYELYNKNGKRIVWQNYKKGVLDGVSNEYYGDGQLALQANYRDNTLIGSFVRYYKGSRENALKEEECFFNKKGYAVCEGWYQNKLKKFTGLRKVSYSSQAGLLNLKHGAWSYWSEEGRFDKISYYKEDKAVRNDYIEFRPIYDIVLDEKVNFFSFTPKGKYLFFITQNRLLIYDYLRKENVFDGKFREISYVDFSQNEKEVLVRQENNYKLININTHEVQVLEALKGFKKVRFSRSNSDHLIIAGDEVRDDSSKLITGVFKISTREFILKSVYKKMLKASLLSKGDVFFIKLNEGRLSIMNLKKEEEASNLNYDDKLSHITFTPGGESIFYITKDESYGAKGYLVKFANHVKAVTYDSLLLGKSKEIGPISSADRFLSLVDLSTIQIYDLEQKAILSVLKYGESPTSLFFDPKNEYLVLMKNKREVLIFNLLQKKVIKNVSFERNIEKIDLSPDGRFVSIKTWSDASSYTFGIISLLEMATGLVKAEIEIPGKEYYSSFSDNSYYLSIMMNGNFYTDSIYENHTCIKKIFSIKDNKTIMSLEPGSELLSSVFYSENAIYMADINHIKSKKDSTTLFTIYEKVF